MKTFEVVIKKPSKVKDWSLWDEKEYYKDSPTTTAILTAFSSDRLKAKISKLYGDCVVISVTEIEL